MHRLLILILSFSLLSSCSLLRYQAEYVEENPRANTRTQSIEHQEKKVYSFNNGSITFDNLFDGARLNDCIQLNDSTYHIVITPENEPINASPWYAFRIVSKDQDDAYLKLTYKNAKHRYHPKISKDGDNWERMNDDRINMSNKDSVANLHLSLTSDTTWVSAQELVNSSQVYHWCDILAENSLVKLNNFGKSALGRPLPVLDISQGKNRNKPIVVIVSRQHPPEITGYYAMQAFVETLLTENSLSNEFFEKFRVLVYPLANPDGVDLGHWRHNAGGVDLNRDWGNYHQPEIRQMTDHIVTASKRSKSNVVLGIDFHSTSRDIYYTNTVNTDSLEIKDFKDQWLTEIENRIPNYKVREEASGTTPVAVSKAWFFAELNAEGITYEIGDKTPKEFIQKKGKISAQVMMELLINP